MPRKKILAIDDEEDLIQLIRFGLEGAAYRVLSADSAESGLELIRKSKPDLILLDVVLPEMDGLELLRLVRPEVEAPIILVSGQRSGGERALGLKAGADDFLAKPFSLDELRAYVARHLGPRGKTPPP